MEATIPMIKASELRIGNWVYGSMSQHYQVNTVILRALEGNAFYVKPIPLTPEILEKAGFSTSAYHSWGNPSIRIGGEDYHPNILTLFDGEYMIHYCNPNDGCNGKAKIKYLHQLQNLYFALTGEELEINL